MERRISMATSAQASDLRREVDSLQAELEHSRREVNKLRGEVASYRIMAEDSERGRQQALQDAGGRDKCMR